MQSQKSHTKIPSLFITGTDTEIGKTVVTGLLFDYLRKAGYSVITQKWIQTGCTGFPEDIAEHLRIAGMDESQLQSRLSDICPFQFELPASPHLAAAEEGAKIEPDKIIESFYRLSSGYDCVLAEGLGGALVPLDENRLVIDIVEHLNLPVLIVAANKLGALNHTLLTIEAVRRRNLPLAGVVFNNISPETSSVIVEDNPKIIRRFTGENVIGTLPYGKDPENLKDEFSGTGDKLLKILKEMEL